MNMATLQTKMKRAFVLGNGWTKIAWLTGDKLKLDGFPSVLADEAASINFDGLNSGNNLILEVGNRRIAVGETAFKLSRMPQTLMDRDRVNSEFFRTLFLAALAVSCPKSGEVSVVLSLPLSWYESREVVRGHFEGAFDLCVNGEARTYDVTRVRIVPEGFGTLCGAVLRLDGQIDDDTRSLTELDLGVVELGSFTTDCSLFSSLELIPSKSGTIRAGLSDVWTMEKQDISRLYNQDFALHEVDQIVQAGGFYQGDKWIDTTALSQRGFRALADKTRNEIASLWSGGKAVRKMILSGGGASEQYGMKELLGFSNAEVIAFADKEARRIARKAPWAADAIGGVAYQVLADANEGGR